MNRHIAAPTVRARASLLAVLSVASVSPAMAYIDPGTGSMLVQMTLAGIAGALFYFRQLRMTAVDWFRRVVLRQAPATQSKPSVSETIS
jgi:hypothetical protein